MKINCGRQMSNANDDDHHHHLLKSKICSNMTYSFTRRTRFGICFSLLFFHLRWLFGQTWRQPEIWTTRKRQTFNWQVHILKFLFLFSSENGNHFWPHQTNQIQKLVPEFIVLNNFNLNGFHWCAECIIGLFPVWMY